MASPPAATPEHDPLLLLRQAISSSSALVTTSSADPDASAVPLAEATHLRFSGDGVSLPLEAPTHFVSNDKPVLLRSIYFAWQGRELAIPEYNASATTLNEQLAAAGEGTGRVQNLGFIERLDLITWLEGASEESEYIRPAAGDAATGAAAAVRAAPTTKPGAAASAAKARSGKAALTPRLASVYSAERRMGDRNTVLRGIKPTVSFSSSFKPASQSVLGLTLFQDFSHVRKLALPFLQKKSVNPAATGNNPSIPMNPKAPSRRPDPIILLSPSASSLLRMSNARSFLEEGRFVPPDAAASTASMLHVQRLMRGIDTVRPLRFILVEGSEQFKPEYWNRIVAVFTTGQTWQFKNYKWSNPNELFKHVLGVFVGWRGELAPENVRGWRHRVVSAGVDRWRGGGHDASRFRDKEVVEHIWKMVEMSMRSKGWRADRAPMSI